MPRAMFDQTLAPARKNRRPFGTVTLSVMLHASALVVVLALQFTSSIDGLIVASSTPVFVVPPKLTPPPVVTPPVPVRRVVTPTPAPALDVPVVPTIPPDGFTASTSIAPLTGPPVPPGSVVGQVGTDPGLLTRIGTSVSMGERPEPRLVRIGGSILPPTRLVYVPPVYPSVAQTARIEGEVALEATIDEKGVVQNLVLRQSVPLLDRAAMDAVARWRYSPTLLNGQPVSVIMLVRVKFTLK